MRWGQKVNGLMKTTILTKKRRNQRAERKVTKAKVEVVEDKQALLVRKDQMVKNASNSDQQIISKMQ